MGSSASHSIPLTSDALIRPQIDLLDPATQAAFDQQEGSRRIVQAGTIILAEGDCPTAMEVIRSGWAIRYKSLGDGRRQIVSILLPGDLIGLQSEMAGVASATVEAITEVQLQAANSPALGEAGSHLKPAELSALATVQKVQAETMMLSVGQRDAVERMAALLLDLFDRASARGMVHTGALAMPLRQKHLSETLGLSVIHVNRVIGVLTRAAIIRLNHRRLEVLDRDRLARAAQSPARPGRSMGTPAPAIGSEKRILVVEDEFHTAQYVDEILRRMGLRVIGPVGTVKEAILLAKTQPIDAALLDVRLQHSDRSDAVAELLRGRRIPFSFITAYADHSINRSPTETVLRKPFREAQLQSVVRSLMQTASSTVC